jgi:hypothetical protein
VEVYVILVGDATGTEATDACLRNVQNETVHVVDVFSDACINTGDVYETVTLIPPIMEPPPIIIIYPYPDIEGIERKRDQHDSENKIKFRYPSIEPILFRRLQKRSYSGQNNLRFKRST